MNRQTNRYTGRQMDRQEDRHADKLVSRQIDEQTNREAYVQTDARNSNNRLHATYQINDQLSENLYFSSTVAKTLK